MRRLALALLWLASLAGAGLAQEPGRTYRLGIVTRSPHSGDFARAFALPALERHGFAEGRNLRIEARVGTAEQMPSLAREIAASKPDAILAIASNALAAAREASDTIPIVGYGPDPARLGLAASHARPGGNVTGIVILATELDAKRLQLLHEAVLGSRKVAALVHGLSRGTSASVEAMRAAATAMGLDLTIFEVSRRDDYPAAFAAMRAGGAEALVIQADAQLSEDAPLIMPLALKARLPAVCEWRELAEQGCLIGYGPSRAQLYGRVGEYVARIFKGAAPGDLPIEQPTALELTVNLKTAKALGLEVPPALLARADEVIE